MFEEFGLCSITGMTGGAPCFLRRSLKRGAGHRRREAGPHACRSPAPYTFLPGHCADVLEGRAGRPVPSASICVFSGRVPGLPSLPCWAVGQTPLSTSGLCSLLSPARAFHCFGEGVWRDRALSVGGDCSGLLM